MNNLKAFMVIGLVGLLVAQTNVQADDYESNNRAKQGWKAVVWKCLPWALAIGGIGFGIKEKLASSSPADLIFEAKKVREMASIKDIFEFGRMTGGKWVKASEDGKNNAPFVKFSKNLLSALTAIKKVAKTASKFEKDAPPEEESN